MREIESAKTIAALHEFYETMRFLKPAVVGTLIANKRSTTIQMIDAQFEKVEGVLYAEKMTRVEMANDAMAGR